MTPVRLRLPFCTSASGTPIFVESNLSFVSIAAIATGRTKSRWVRFEKTRATHQASRPPDRNPVQSSFHRPPSHALLRALIRVAVPDRILGRASPVPNALERRPCASLPPRLTPPLFRVPSDEYRH